MSASDLAATSDLAGRSFERILLVKPSSLGDVVHALPVLHGLRTRYPSATIDWLIAEPFAPLIEEHPELDGAIRFDRRRYGQMAQSPRALREFASFVQGLRARRYDLVVDLQGLFRTGFLTRASGAGVRIGFRQAREGAWIFYTHFVPIDDPNIHAVDRYYLTGKLLGFDHVPPEFGLPLKEATRTETTDRLRSSGVAEGERIVAVVPGTRWPTKMWPAERFSDVIDELHARKPARCVLLGGPDEVSLCAGIAERCKSKPINLAGETSIPQLAAAISLSDAVLCHDSAASHLAVALNRPLVCLCGPTNPRRTGPWGRPDDVQQLDLDCSPCYLRRLSQCRHEHRCMRDLDAQRVLTAVVRSLESCGK